MSTAKRAAVEECLRLNVTDAPMKNGKEAVFTHPLDGRQVRVKKSGRWLEVDVDGSRQLIGLGRWLLCPRCGTQRRSLFLPPEGKAFGCLDCHKLTRAAWRAGNGYERQPTKDPVAWFKWLSRRGKAALWFPWSFYEHEGE